MPDVPKKGKMTKIVLIYGGSGGIGLATARLVQQAGFHPHLVGRDAERLTAAAETIGAGTSVGDVLDDALFARATADAIAAPGGMLAGLVYAVGTINLKPLARLTDADFYNDYRINALGAVKAAQAAQTALKACEGGASVVLFSTVAVRQGFAAHASIAMAKGAVEGLTLSLAAELAPNVRVNAIAPSLTKTPLARAIIRNEPLATGLAAMHPLGRLGEAEDIAHLAAFLISPQASWITGQIIGVDGGRSTLRVKG